FICIYVQSPVSSEMRCTPAADPGEFTVLAPRERDVEYDADHHNGRWVIRTNWDAPNFRVMTAPSGATSRDAWQEWLGHSDEVFIEHVELFDGFTVIGERSEGLERVRVIREDGAEEYVKADEPAYSMGLSVNSEPDTQWLRSSYTSLPTPPTNFEHNVDTDDRLQPHQK